MHVSEQSKPLPPIQPPPHCPKNCSSVASLHHQDSLQEEFTAAGLSTGFAEASSEVSREVHCCFPQHSRCLHHKRYKMVIRVQMCILGHFQLLCLCSHNACPLMAAETCEGAWVSGHVASHTRTFQHLHGRMEQP